MGKRDTQFIMILDIDRVFSAEELALVRGQEAGKQEAGQQPVEKQQSGQAACGSGRVRGEWGGLQSIFTSHAALASALGWLFLDEKATLLPGFCQGQK
jgi:hypothetical protein